MKLPTRALLVLISSFPMMAAAQSTVKPALPEATPLVPQVELQQMREEDEKQAHERQKLSQETQTRGYWIDPTTKLMWAAKDNGKAVTWGHAMKYCRALHLAGFSDWRLASINELASLVDKSALAPRRVGNMDVFQINLGRTVRGGLLLTGDPWSIDREKDRFGHPYGDGWFFDFINSKPSFDLQDFRNTKYALCVRRSTE